MYTFAIGEVPMTSVRVAAAAAGLVLVTAMALSYDALAELGRAAGILPVLSWIYPVLIDGLLVVGVVAAVTLRQAKVRIRAYAWIVIAGATAISVVGNGTHALAHGGVLVLPAWGAVLASAVPAGSLASALHLLVVIVRHSGRAPAGPAAPVLTARSEDCATAASPEPRPRAALKGTSRPAGAVGERVRSLLGAGEDALRAGGEARAALIREVARESGASAAHVRKLAAAMERPPLTEEIA
jgi:hypothetical protein